MQNPILTCTTSAYNESRRIVPWVNQARQWADMTIVFDKGSTDNTCELAAEAGATVVSIPYSDAGHEDVETICRNLIPGKWFVWSTPSEIVKPQLARLFRSVAISDSPDFDVLYAPTKLFAFGAHSPMTPFGIVNHPRLINRMSAHIQNQIHNNFLPRTGARIVNFNEDMYVLHQTHANFEKYVYQHVQYAMSEVKNTSDPVQTARQAIATAHRYDYDFSSASGDIRHQLAWKIYHYLVALGCHNKLLEPSTAAIYKDQYNQILDEWKQ